MNRELAACAVLVAALAAGCGAPRVVRPVDSRPSNVLPLGDHYDSPHGSLFVIRVQDEYRLIRCIPEGPIAGCYADVFSVPYTKVHYNRWMDVSSLPGLEITIVSPNEVAFRMRPESGAPR